MSFSNILSVLTVVVTLFVASIVIRRDAHSLAHRVLTLGLVLLAVETSVTGFEPTAGSAEDIIFWQRVSYAVTAFLPGFWIIFSLTFARSNYQEILRKWLWVIISAFTLPILFAVVFQAHFFAPVLKDTNGSIIRFGWSGYLFQLIFILSSVLILANLERTLRNSAGWVLWQIKFVALGVGSLFAARIYFSSQALLFRCVDPSAQVFAAGALLIMDACILRALWRSRVLDTHLYVSTTLLYNSVTVVFVGLYFFSIGIIARIGLYFGVGDVITFRFFYVFLAFLGLAVLLLSGQFRRRLKKVVARHFRRPHFDYRKEWASFTGETTNVTNNLDLCNIVARIVSRTFDADAVTIWLADEADEKVVVAGSTILAKGSTSERVKVEKAMFQLLRFATARSIPIEHDYQAAGWKEETISQELLEEMRIQHTIPLIAAGKLLGVMTVGDRGGTNGLSFSIEDFDLLKIMADQAAANLYNLMLGERLRKAKEMEAFQAMSAFFVHDLKNVASKLSLTMQNLPLHFDNPEFRADALRSFSQSLDKINGMCTRLTALSQRLDVKKLRIDLNQIISTVVAEMGSAIGAEILFTSSPLPPASVDVEQFQKVLVNLLLNAKEATANGGTIKVGTFHRDKWIECSVTDDGCGISQQFIETSLFRPFQTTKKQGMGIGLYHSKSIVEAHNGRIEVESEEGKGTTFRVLLPTAEEK